MLMLEVSLKKLLEAHEIKGNPLAIEMVLGDSYVLKKSKIATAIRELSNKYGYSFTDSNFSFANTLSVISLAYFLREKKITFTDNVSVLRELSGTVGDFVNSSHLLKIGFPANSVLHESAHCIAHYHLFDNRNPFELFNIQEDISVIFRFLIAESYSQAAEVINFKYFLTEDATYLDLFMLKLNTYVNVKRDFVESYQAILELTNSDTAFLFVMLIFFCHNLKMKSIGELDYEKVVRILEQNFDVEKPISWPDVFKISMPIQEFVFSLGHDFVNFTTPLFFKNLGYKGDYLNALNNHLSLDLFLKEKEIWNKTIRMISELNLYHVE